MQTGSKLVYYTVILLLYVDDLFLTSDEKQIIDCKKKLVEEFEMKALGLTHYFLRLEMWQSQEGIFLNQGKYVVESLFTIIFYLKFSLKIIHNFLTNQKIYSLKLINSFLFKISKLQFD